MTTTASLILQDFADITSANKDQCFTVQHLSYRCERERNLQGTPFGLTQPSFMTVTFRAAKDDTAQELMERMMQQEPFPFSILFDPVFNEDKKLTSYADAMMVRAYPVSVEEFKNVIPAKADSPEEEQMLIRARLLLCKIVILGLNKNLPLIISAD